MTFLLCDPGWCVHKSDVLKRDDNTPCNEMTWKHFGVSITTQAIFFMRYLILLSGNLIPFHCVVYDLLIIQFYASPEIS